MAMSESRESPFRTLRGGAFANFLCVQGWRQGVLHRVVVLAIAAWVVQDIRAGCARRHEPVDVRASVQTARDSESTDWKHWHATVPRTCAPSFMYVVPSGRPMLASDALRHCLPLLSEDGYVRLTPELMRYNADTLTLDSWSVPDCGLQFGDQLVGVMFDAPGAMYDAPGGEKASYTFQLLQDAGGDAAGDTSWLAGEPGTKSSWFAGSWQGVGMGGALSMKIGKDVELGNGQRLPIVEQNGTHIVVVARDGTIATGKAVGDQLHWDVCEAECELERMPEFLARPTRSVPWEGIVALGNSSKEKSWWQDPAEKEMTLLFHIDASTPDQELDDTLAKMLQEHASQSNILLERMHVDVTKLWIKDRTMELVSYYDYEPPWTTPGADARELYFPLEVYGNWLSQTSEAHDWRGLRGALKQVADVDGKVSFLVQSVGAEPCFFAPPGEDHVKRIDESRVHLRAFTAHSARMVTKEVSGTPLQHVDQHAQMKTWSYWSSDGYNGDVWIGDANYVDHSHSVVSVNFKVNGGDVKEQASVQTCDATTGECGEASHADIVTDSWMGMQASSVRLPVRELLSRSGTDLARCVDRCSIGVELNFENRLWTSWMMSPWTLLKRGRKGEVSLSIRVSGGNHHSSFKDIDIVRHNDTSMIHTAEHGGAVVGVFVTGEFGYADAGFFLTHVGALVGVLYLGVAVCDALVERFCCQKEGARMFGGLFAPEGPGEEPDAAQGHGQACDPESRELLTYDKFQTPPRFPAI